MRRRAADERLVTMDALFRDPRAESLHYLVEIKCGHGPPVDALSAFASQVPLLDPLAFRLQGYNFNRVVFDATRDRLTQVLVGELTLDEAIVRIQQEIEEKIAEATTE